MSCISIDGSKFTDESGRERIFHGMNMVFKGEINPETGVKEYIPGWDRKIISWLAESGFNLVRLGVIWDGVEPEPGKYNEEYLGWLAEMISLCREFDIYVFLDMHQDLFSEKYSDGAPAWATLDDGLDHYEGGLWSDSYLFSDAVKRAFDNFWANAPLPCGEGVQDHYAAVWGMLAARYSKYENVIGFDVLNEPFPGSSGLDVFVTLLADFAQLTGKDLSPEELMGLFADENAKLELLGEIDDYELYSSMASAAAEVAAGFEDEILVNFYNKVCRQITTNSENKAFFLENSYFSNMGIMSSVRKPGISCPYVYAPHGYDLVVDSPAVCIASNNRVDVIFNNHRKVQDRLDVPVIVGEWGAHDMYSEGLYHIKHLLSKFDRFKWSHTYWTYFDGIKKAPVMDVLIRPYPVAVAGKIIEYGYDYETKIFRLTWEKSGKEDTVIFLPVKPFDVESESKYRIETLGKDSESCYLRLKDCPPGINELLVRLGTAADE